MNREDAKRFWSRVDRRAPNECWLWDGSREGDYGIFWLNGKRVRAHRASWEHHSDTPIPDGMCACHACDNKQCVNPAHIWIGTHQENIKDAVDKGIISTPPKDGPGWQKRLTHCKRGHLLSGDNVRINRHGNRCCRACQRMHWTKHDRKRRGQPTTRAALEGGDK